MSPKLKTTTVAILLVLTSCVSETERNLRGDYIVKTVKYRDSICDYGTSVFLVNMLSFNNDSTCELPMVIEQRGLGTNGTWHSPAEGLIVIEGCEADFYNDTFKMEIIQNQNFREIHLSNDSIWIKLIKNAPIF